MVRVAVRGDVRAAGTEARDRFDALDGDEGPGQVPVHAVGELVEVQADLVRLHHLAARLDGEVVQEVERLPLGTQPEHEVDHAGDHR